MLADGGWNRDVGDGGGCCADGKDVLSLNFHLLVVLGHSPVLLDGARQQLNVFLPKLVIGLFEFSDQSALVNVLLLQLLMISGQLFFLFVLRRGFFREVFDVIFVNAPRLFPKIFEFKVSSSEDGIVLHKLIVVADL